MPAKQIELIGVSKHIQEVREDIKAVANKEVTVLIEGPTGSGKEVVANNIHFASGRAKNKFVPVNCAKITRSLFESEFFGYVKGAFTGAGKDKDGYIQAAEGGTLFLDEIGEIPQNVQAKLLRFIEDGMVVKVGSNQAIKVDVRIIAATNRPERLRDDLKARLSGRVIRTKPLADRPEDIVCLVHHFLDSAGITKVDARVKFLLYCYDFPTNVRELKGWVENADNFGYVRRELAYSWHSRNKPRALLMRPARIGVESREDFIAYVQEEASPKMGEAWDYYEYFAKANKIASDCRFFQALLFVEEGEQRHEFAKIVEAYEIWVLAANTTKSELSANDIRKMLSIRQEKVGQEKYEKIFSITWPRSDARNNRWANDPSIDLWTFLALNWGAFEEGEYLPLGEPKA